MPEAVSLRVKWPASEVNQLPSLNAEVKNTWNYTSSSNFKKPTKCTIKYSKTEHKTHFISSANSYMFVNQSAIIREFINN
jgi:hypothetical protein